MKRNLLVGPLALLGLVGCSGPAAPVAIPTEQPEAVSTLEGDASAAATLVSLNVPNMH
jgi:hypothetical protein